MTAHVQLGLRQNGRQFILLVLVNALVGSMVGLERSVLPLAGEQDFHVASSAALLAFIVAFGAAKALSNLLAASLAERHGRKAILVTGWAIALPVPMMVGLAPSWGWIVTANVLLGVNQGLAWSMTVVMKIDLVGPARRGLALGLNEAAGYLGMATTAFATGVLAASYAPRDVVWVGAAAVAVAGLVASATLVRDTAAHVAVEQERIADVQRPAHSLGSMFAQATMRDPVLRSCSQAGLVNNLNDALAWGLVPLYLAGHGVAVGQIALVAALYPVVWGLGQVASGWLSDHAGRKPLIVAGMLVQAVSLMLMVGAGPEVDRAAVAAALLGLGTALVYPTLIAAVSDAVQPRDRARAVSVYRFWRDVGFVVGALVAGLASDLLSPAAAIAIVAGMTCASGMWVAASRWQHVR